MDKVRYFQEKLKDKIIKYYIKLVNLKFEIIFSLFTYSVFRKINSLSGSQKN